MSLQLADFLPPAGSVQMTMLAIATIATAGIVAGLLYRAGAAVALSFIALFVTLIATLNQGWPFWRSALAAFGLMALLQLSYLVGVAFAVGMQRARSTNGVRSTLSALFRRNVAR
jgi:hypothetical protein